MRITGFVRPARAIATRPRAASARAVVIGVSGPDGAGKSGLIRRLRSSLAGDGVPVATTYLYGCVICRRLPRQAAEVTLRLSMSPGRSRARSVARWLRAAHGLLDAAELTLRLAVSATLLSVRSGTRSGSGGGRPVLLTDRSPLDGLAKHLPGPGSFTARAYRRLVDRYDGILLLSAPPDVLAARDRDHDPAALAAAASRFDCAAQSLQFVTRIETGDKGPDQVAAVARTIVAGRLEPGDAGRSAGS